MRLAHVLTSLIVRLFGAATRPPPSSARLKKAQARFERRIRD